MSNISCIYNELQQDVPVRMSSHTDCPTSSSHETFRNWEVPRIDRKSYDNNDDNDLPVILLFFTEMAVSSEYFLCTQEFASPIPSGPPVVQDVPYFSSFTYPKANYFTENISLKYLDGSIGLVNLFWKKTLYWEFYRKTLFERILYLDANFLATFEQDEKLRMKFGEEEIEVFIKNLKFDLTYKNIISAKCELFRAD